MDAILQLLHIKTSHWQTLHSLTKIAAWRTDESAAGFALYFHLSAQNKGEGQTAIESFLRDSLLGVFKQSKKLNAPADVH